MAKSRSPWRALRPALLAGAATLTWLTFSSTAASADTLPDSSSLLGGVTSSVASVTERVAAPVAPAASAPAGLLQPVTDSISGLADSLVSSVPVVNQVVPAGTVTAVSTPIAQVADGTTATVVDVVVAPVVETVPVLEPVVEPVAGLVTGTDPLPLPDLPATAVDVDLSEAPAAATDTDGPAAGAAAPAGGASVLEAVAQEDAGLAETGNAPAGTVGAAILALAGAPAYQWDVDPAPAILADQPTTVDPSAPPAQTPAAPATGTGSSVPAGGSSGTAAWLHTLDFHLPIPGALLAAESIENAPSPVSDDPGSRPD